MADAGLPQILNELSAVGLSTQDSSSDGPLAGPDEEDRIGVHEQNQPGLFSIGVPVAVGRLTGAQMRKIADLAERHGAATIRLTAQQNILIPNIPKENVAAVLEGLGVVGLKASASPISLGLLACVEREFCRELIQHLEGRILLEEPIQIHVSDGSGTCAHSAAAQIELHGNSSGFDISIASSAPILCNVPASEVKVRLEQLLVGYKKRRKAGESFNQFCRRVGDSHLARILEPV